MCKLLAVAFALGCVLTGCGQRSSSVKLPAASAKLPADLQGVWIPIFEGQPGRYKNGVLQAEHDKRLQRERPELFLPYARGAPPWRHQPIDSSPTSFLDGGFEFTVKGRPRPPKVEGDRETFWDPGTSHLTWREVFKAPAGPIKEYMYWGVRRSGPYHFENSANTVVLVWWDPKYQSELGLVRDREYAERLKREFDANLHKLAGQRYRRHFGLQALEWPNPPDLNLTLEQRQWVQELHAQRQQAEARLAREMRQSAGAGGDNRPLDYRDPRWQALRNEYDARIEAILTPEQKARWKQLLRGP